MDIEWRNLWLPMGFASHNPPGVCVRAQSTAASLYTCAAGWRSGVSLSAGHRASGRLFPLFLYSPSLYFLCWCGLVKIGNEQVDCVPRCWACEKKRKRPSRPSVLHVAWRPSFLAGHSEEEEVVGRVAEPHNNQSNYNRATGKKTGKLFRTGWVSIANPLPCWALLHRTRQIPLEKKNKK